MKVSIDDKGLYKLVGTTLDSLDYVFTTSIEDGDGDTSLVNFDSSSSSLSPISTNKFIGCMFLISN